MYNSKETLEVIPLRILSCVFIFLTVISLSACTLDPKDESNSLALIESVKEDIEAFLPLYVNQSFYLPSFEGVMIEWAIDGKNIEHKFIYEEPFLKKPVTLEATIKNNNYVKVFTFDLIILPQDSPLNNNVINIKSDTDYFELSKETYAQASIRISSTVNDEHLEVFSSNFLEIKGRGNSTWTMPKKPLRLKFNEAVSLLNLPATQDYVLLAEYADKSLMRNMIAYKFSSLLQAIEYSPQGRFVELYMNDEYLGVYVLTNQIEPSEEIINIPTDLSSEDAGFFLELDQRFLEEGRVEGVDGFYASGIPYVIDQPSPGEDLQTYHIEYIKNYILAMQTALMNRHGYDDYLDIDNFIDYFIAQELFKNVDVGWGSVYSYKKPNERLKLGPLWDFDLAMGNADYIDYGPENWYGMRNYKNYWFKLMMDVSLVRDEYQVRYQEIYEEIMPLLLKAVQEIGESLSPYAERNFDRWEILDIYVWPNPVEMQAATTHQEQVEYLYEFLQLRSNWMYHAMQTEAYQNGHFDD